MRLILIRHGQTPSNVRGLLDTAVPGPGLTELGHEQAAALVPALGAEPIEALFASNLTRTQLTAAPLAQALGLELRIREGLREISAGALEMRSDLDSVRAYLTPLGHWAIGELDARLPGGPDGHETLGRFDAVIQEMLASGHQLVAAVSHGAMIRLWTAVRAENIDAGFLRSETLSNTGTVVLEYRPGNGGDGGNSGNGQQDGSWWVLDWEGRAVGGAELEDAASDGPAAEPIG